VSTGAAVVNRHGPSAFGGDVRRFFTLTYTLASTEFKLRFFGSVLGYLWSLMRPLMLFGVLYVVFTKIVRFAAIPHYPVYLLTAIVLFTFFGEATGGSVASLVARESLLRKIRFPRMVIPCSVVMTAMFNLGMNLIACVIFALANGVSPRWSWLAMIPLVLILAILATGTSMLLSALYVRYRDIQPIWDVFQQILFYGSPILYTAAQFKNHERLAMCNPIAVVITEMRKVFIDPSAPSAAEAIGGAVYLLIPFAITVGVFAIGLWVFSREAPRVAENL
jgi:ABC-2 type transport system permease protein